MPGLRPITNRACIWRITSNAMSGWYCMMASSNGNMASLAFCEGNSPVTGECPSQRPVTRTFDIFFDLRLNKPLSKQSIRRWFETQSRSLWRQCNENRMSLSMNQHFSLSDELTIQEARRTWNEPEWWWMYWPHTYPSQQLSVHCSHMSRAKWSLSYWRTVIWILSYPAGLYNWHHVKSHYPSVKQSWKFGKIYRLGTKWECKRSNQIKMNRRAYLMAHAVWVKISRYQ